MRQAVELLREGMAAERACRAEFVGVLLPKVMDELVKQGKVTTKVLLRPKQPAVRAFLPVIPPTKSVRVTAFELFVDEN